MLENIRKYSALMAIVLALFAFGIIFVGNSGSAGGSLSDQTMVSVEDMGITNKEFTKRGTPPQSFYLSGANVPNPMFFIEFGQTIGRVTLPGVNQNEQFAMISLLARVEARKLGIFVTQDDAEKFILNTLFNDGEDGVHMSRYNEFAEFINKNMGLKEADFRTLIADYLTIQKVAQVKNGVNVPFSVIQKANDIAGAQTIDSDIVQFDFTSFEGTAEPSEQEVKEFFEAEKNGDKYGRTHFYTQRKVKLSFIPVNLAAQPKATESNIAEIETFKVKQESDYKNYRKFVNDDTRVGEYNAKTLAEEYNLPFITTELVTKDGLEKFFEDYKLQGEFKNRGTVHNYLLNPTIMKTKKLELHVPDSHKTSFLHYYIEEVEEPQLKSYEDAKEKAKELLIKELEVEKMTEAAEKARELLVTAKKEGQDLKKEVKSVGGNVYSEPKFTAQTTTLNLKHIPSLFQSGAILSPNSVSEVVRDDDSASFIVVYKREVEKQEGYDSIEANQNNEQAELAFGEWVINQFEQTENKKFTPEE